MKRKDHTVAAHKSFLMFLLLIVFFAFTACNTKGNNSERLASSTMPDFQYMFKYDGARIPTQKSDSGLTKSLKTASFRKAQNRLCQSRLRIF